MSDEGTPDGPSFSVNSHLFLAAFKSFVNEKIKALEQGFLSVSNLQLAWELADEKQKKKIKAGVKRLLGPDSRDAAYWEHHLKSLDPAFLAKLKR